MKDTFHHAWLRSVLFLAGITLPIGLAQAANPADLLEPGHFVNYVKASPDQVDALNSWVDGLRSAIAAHQWAYGKRTNEGRLWQGVHPRLKDLHELQKQTRVKTDTYLDSIRSVLTSKQKERLHDILKKDDLLGYPIEDVPFHRISASPLKPRFQDNVRAYQVEVPGPNTAASNWSYEDLLEIWTVSQYIRLPDPMANDTFMRSPNIQVRSDSPTLRSLIVRSPLIVSATLFVPDLAGVEFGLLYNYYEHTFENRESAWQNFGDTNGLDDHILVRLRLSTPYNAYYLSTDRYIFFIQNRDGTGFEPKKMEAKPVRKVEALEIRVPGRTVTYTDVFGTYTGQPGYRETRALSGPEKITYSGQERLIKLFFPARDFSGSPVISGETREITLIIQPDLENLPRMELSWEMRKKPKANR